MPSSSKSRGLPTAAAFPRKRPTTPRPVRDSNASRAGDVDPFFRRRRDERGRERVRRALLERRGDAEQRLVRGPGEQHAVRQPGPALRHRPRLVEEHGGDGRGRARGRPRCGTGFRPKRARPVPTRIAVGVASPSAHGHAIRSTDASTIVAKSARGSGPGDVPHDPRHDGQTEDDGHEHPRDAVGELLDRRLRGLRLPDEPDDLRERRVRPDGRRLDLDRALLVQRSADHAVAGPPLRGHRLAGDHRLVDGGRRRTRTTPSTGTDSPGLTSSRSPTRTSASGDLDLHRRCGRAAPSSARDRGASGRPPRCVRARASRGSRPRRISVMMTPTAS